MPNFFDILLDVLKHDNRFVANDGTFVRNAVYEASIQMDSNLIHLLLANPETKKEFFRDVDGVLVFDKVGFGWIINNRQFLPDSYTRFKNKIGLADENGELISASNKVELVFPYKDCVLEGGQTKEEQKRKEIFYNEALARSEIDKLLYPKVLINAVRCDSEGESRTSEFCNDDNLIIKGNNLLALSTLLKRYEGKVKCIYIDPPYFFKNSRATDTFKYNSNFHFSSWLVFLKNRLEIAKKLMCQGATIWINISEDGMHYLKVVCDDIFGADHFVGTIPRRTRTLLKSTNHSLCPQWPESTTRDPQTGPTHGNLRHTPADPCATDAADPSAHFHLSRSLQSSSSAVPTCHRTRPAAGMICLNILFMTLFLYYYNVTC